MKIIKYIAILILIIALSGCATKENTNNENCYMEEYKQYPCSGATHYARVHRNNNEPCERWRQVCKVEDKEME